nr:MgtC/SapB family protein [uncultured Tolumonas sp.]
MNILGLESLTAYWSKPELAINILIFINVLGALILGLIIGYERSYHGRAAGMRTYGLVCMASAALTVIAGYPSYWYGGLSVISSVGPDPTRIIQGIVTGIGFLGAGVIMREGFNISGLSTAASIWTSAAIGIMMGVGFYSAAISLALLSVICMIWVSLLENWLPSHKALALTLQFSKEFIPLESTLRAKTIKCGYEISNESLSITLNKSQMEWRFVVIALSKNSGISLEDFGRELAQLEGLENFALSHARN